MCYTYLEEFLIAQSSNKFNVRSPLIEEYSGLQIITL